MTAVAEQFPLLENRFFFRAPGCPGSSYILIKRGKNFSVTLIQANMGWIDVAFNLLCILKEWDFPGHHEGIPKKKKKNRQTSVSDNRVLSTCEDDFSLV